MNRNALIVTVLVLLVAVTSVFAIGWFRGCSSQQRVPVVDVVKPLPKPVVVVPPKPEPLPNNVLLDGPKTQAPIEKVDNNLLGKIEIPKKAEEEEHNWIWALKQMEDGAKVCKDSQNYGHGEYFYIKDDLMYSYDLKNGERLVNPSIFEKNARWWKIENVIEEHDWKWAINQMKDGAKVAPSSSNGQYYYMRKTFIYSNGPDGIERRVDITPTSVDGKWWKITNLDDFLKPYTKVAVVETPKRPVALASVAQQESCSESTQTYYSRPGLIRRIFGRR